MKDLPDKQSKKIAWTLRLVRDLEQVPTQYLKKLKSTDDIWEVRATIDNNTFRLLGFFDGISGLCSPSNGRCAGTCIRIGAMGVEVRNIRTSVHPTLEQNRVTGKLTSQQTEELAGRSFF